MLLHHFLWPRLHQWLRTRHQPQVWRRLWKEPDVSSTGQRWVLLSPSIPIQFYYAFADSSTRVKHCRSVHLIFCRRFVNSICKQSKGLNCIGPIWEHVPVRVNQKSCWAPPAPDRTLLLLFLSPGFSRHSGPWICARVPLSAGISESLSLKAGLLCCRLKITLPFTLPPLPPSCVQRVSTGGLVSADGADRLET